jgi:alpha-N-arabinofuranosidase
MKLEEIYNLEDALVTAIQLNAFIRHANIVKMANIAQIVNVISPIFTSSEGLVLQTIFYPFELYSRTCGNKAVDVWWGGDTFTGGNYTGVRTLDVTATLDEQKKQIVIYVVNRSRTDAMETEISIVSGGFKGEVTACVVSGPNIKAENTFNSPTTIHTKENKVTIRDKVLKYIFDPHSVSALVCEIS